MDFCSGLDTSLRDDGSRGLALLEGGRAWVRILVLYVFTAVIVKLSMVFYLLFVEEPLAGVH